jgi:chromosome segregation ATPase
MNVKSKQLAYTVKDNDALTDENIELRGRLNDALLKCEEESEKNMILQDKVKQSADFEVKLKALEQENEVLFKDVAAQKEKSKSVFEVKLKALEQENDVKIKEVEEEHAVQIKELERKNQDQVEQQGKEEAKNIALTDQLKEYKVKVDSYEAKIKTIEGFEAKIKTIEAYEVKIKSMEAKVQSLESTNKSIRHKNKTLETVNDKFRSKIEELEEELQEKSSLELTAAASFKAKPVPSHEVHLPEVTKKPATKTRAASSLDRPTAASLRRLEVLKQEKLAKKTANFKN